MRNLTTVLIYFLSEYVNYILIAIWLLACATGNSDQITWYQYAVTIGFMFYNWLINKGIKNGK